MNILAESTNILQDLYAKLPDLIPALIAVAVVIAGLWIANWLLLHRKRDLNEESRFPRRIAMILLAAVGIVFILFALP